jgi:hypothetical protein
MAGVYLHQEQVSEPLGLEEIGSEQEWNGLIVEPLTAV